jgi:hypothetical protein
MRKRSLFSIKRSLLDRAKEAALTAVQAYNNPLTQFKSESYIVLMMIAWTYLLHAYYRQERVEYRQFERRGNRRRFARNQNGTFRYWSLLDCLDASSCPLDSATKSNLRFLVGLRNEIEHHMPPAMDEYLGSRFLACALNFEYWLTSLFGSAHSLQSAVAVALQFADIQGAPDVNPEPALPARVAKYIREFEEALPDEEFQSERYKFSVFFVKRTVGKPGQAERIVEFVSPDDPRAQGLQKDHYTIRETERPKFLPGEIVRMMKAEGFSHFGMQRHIDLWKANDAKNPGKGYGIAIGGIWYWYEPWVDFVRRHCRKHADQFR